MADLYSNEGYDYIHSIIHSVYRDVRRHLENSLVVPSNQEENFACHGAYTVPDGTSASSRLCRPSTGLGVNEEGTSELDLPVNSEFTILENNYSSGGICFVLKGFMLPIFGLRFARRLALTTWSCTLYYVRSAQAQVVSIISRVRRTLGGSSDDVGWLQNDPGMAPVKDGSARFLELLEHIRNGEHTLPHCLVYLLIPGLFSNHGPLYFVSTKRFFSKIGLACHIAKIHSEASVEHNAWELKQYIEELYWGSGKRVMLLGHTKGGVDAAAALSIYEQQLEDKVAGLALVQSPYGGTPVASDILREGQIADKETRRIMEFLICKLSTLLCPKFSATLTAVGEIVSLQGDIRALEDLTYEKRKEFTKNHKLPGNIPLISFHSEASVAPGVVATMTHIAQAEIPWLPRPHFGNEDSAEILQATRKVPVILPISAAMALCALHLQLRYGQKSGGLVTWRDAEVPVSVIVKPNRKLDHAWMLYTSWKKNPSEPDCCEMCEAILTLLVELGRQRKDQMVIQRT